jgi:hypothetical protein
MMSWSSLSLVATRGLDRDSPRFLNFKDSIVDKILMGNRATNQSIEVTHLDD